MHQPGYLPWLGFFKKMMNVDVFVFFDNAQFVKNNFYHRNKIKTTNGVIWLTVPVIAKGGNKINEVNIDNSKNWAKKHLKSILYNYSHAKYFDDFNDYFKNLYEKEFNLLLDLNIEIINFVKESLKIKTKTVFASEFNIQKKASEIILDICKSLKADHYISGTVWAKDNLDLEKFKENKITVEFQEFQHPEYLQMHGDFEKTMSIIDLLFNEGVENSRKILEEAKTS